MTLLFCGVAMGFVLATALFIQRIWSLQDRVEYYKERADFFKKKSVEEYKQRLEWENAKNEASEVLVADNDSGYLK